MDSFVDSLNQTGAAFCGLSWTMLIQSGVLIVVLYAVDLLIRRKVRAIVRYGVWMLVLIKLILPPTLSVPTGIGYWVSVPTSAQKIRTVKSKPVLPVAARATPMINRSPARTETTPQPFIETSTVRKIQPAIAVPIEAEKVHALVWRQAWVLCAWVAGMIAMLGLLFQRLWFVRRLLAQSRPAYASWQELTYVCAERLDLRKPIEVRVSDSLHSPAACGLMRPVILVPEAIEHTLSRDKLRAILLHELVHIARADLWVNLAQTLLQVVYFYNPLLWLANAQIRNLREKAVDETVLTKLGQHAAGQYSTTLIDIAERAFSKPHFSLGLIGVVESKKALTGRIKHILGRPMPTSAKIGIAGLVAITVGACLLLPMTRGPWQWPLEDEETRSLLAQISTDEEDPSRFAFPDNVIPNANRTISPDLERQYEQVRQYIDESKGELTKGQYMASRREFEALSQMTDAFPLTLYAQRWLIILDWLYGKCDAASVVEQMNRLAEPQTDMPQANFTRAYAAVILARDGHLDQAHDAFLKCPPTLTPQWGWFVFEMNKYMSRYVEGCAPNVDRLIRGGITQKARTDRQWQVLETDLRAAQTAYADYIEYDLLPQVVAVVNGRKNHRMTAIETLQCVDCLRTLITQHLGSFSLGSTTKAIETRICEQITPKILAAWHESLQLFDAEQQARDIEAYNKEIETQCKKSGLPMDTLPMWWERISTDADKVASDVKTTWVEAGKMPHVVKVHLVMREVSNAELRTIHHLIKQLKSEDEAVWQDAAKKLSAIGPKVAGPLSELFNQGSLDIKALNILKPMAGSEHVQAVMVSVLEFNRALYNNATHCALTVLAASRNQGHVPMIVRRLQEGLNSHEEPTMEAMALGQLGGEKAYAALCQAVVRDVSPTLRWIVAEQLVKFHNRDAIPYLETASDAFDVSENAGPKRRVNQCICTLSGGATDSLYTFTMPVYDRNVPNFSQYIGGNLSRFDTDYVNLKPYGLQVGVSPETLFSRQNQCAFYMKKGHEFVGIRGTRIAPITLPELGPAQNWGWTDRLGLVYAQQIVDQIKTYVDNHINETSMLLKEGGLYGLVTPDNDLLVTRVKFGHYETGAEATTLTCLKLATGIERSDSSTIPKDTVKSDVNPNMPVAWLKAPAQTRTDVLETLTQSLASEDMAMRWGHPQCH